MYFFIGWLPGDQTDSHVAIMCGLSVLFSQKFSATEDGIFGDGKGLGFFPMGRSWGEWKIFEMHSIQFC